MFGQGEKVVADPNVGTPALASSSDPVDMEIALQMPVFPTQVQSTVEALSNVHPNADESNDDVRGTINSDPPSYARKDSLQGENKGVSKTPENLKRHHRGVSWDQTVTDNEKVLTPPKLPMQPELSDGNSMTDSLMTKTNLPPRPPMISKKVSIGSKPKEYFAMELEAETELMRNLDERDPLRPRAGTGNSVLSGVPMDMLQHDFSLDELSTGSQKTPASPTGTPPRMTAPRTPPRPRAGSKDSRLQSERSVNSLKAKTHRRQLTVEEALFGLTSALSAIKHDDIVRHDNPDSEMTDTRERADTATSTDRLTATANLIFRRIESKRQVHSQPPEEISLGQALPAPLEAQPKTATKNKWDLLRENLNKANKANDAQDGLLGEGMPDIEADTPTDSGETSGDPMETVNEGDEDEDKKKKKLSWFGKGKKKSNPFRHLPYAENIKNEWDTFNEFLKPRKSSMWTYARYILLYLWLPALGVAALLFHVFENPSTGKGEDADNSKASASWLLIFICIREVFILILAKCMEVLIVDFFALSTKAILRTFGPLITLLIVQSKGWPFLTTFWGIFNFALVTGNHKFSHHWLYWQNIWDLFNENNPSGNVTSSLWFYRITAIATGIGIAVAIKRLAVGILLGRQTFANFSEPLTKVMNKMLHVSQVAALAKEIEKRSWQKEMKQARNINAQPSTRGFSADNLASLIDTANAEDEIEDASSFYDATRSIRSDEENDMVVDPDDIDPYTGGLRYSQRARIQELLGRWEEPLRGPTQLENVSISAILQFRRALAHMDTDYPFSAAFGIAETRETCITSAQEVYKRLMLKKHTINGQLHFDTIAVVALKRHGDLDNDKAKDLIKTFRPDRDGGISMVDFVRSVDTVYKELRMLRATVASSSKIDQAIETILNGIFYVMLVCIILSQTGFDPLALFLSLSSIILAFAFMISAASSKYFEGLLFILVQRPYGIGDRISVSNSEAESSPGGAQGWIVDNVTLFTTTVYLAGTNERATISNGTLAKSRIINGARSPKAICTVTMKFGVDTPYQRVEVFKSAVEKFVKQRPREWLNLLAFRANSIQADLGFIEYGIVLQHREAWQNIGPVLNSKQTLNQYCLELAKKLDMRYRSPALPVDLNMVGKSMEQLQQLHQSNISFEMDKNAADRRKSAGDFTLSPGSTGGDTTEEIRMIAAMFDGK